MSNASDCKILRQHVSLNYIEVNFKILMLGDFGVGKTSLIRRYRILNFNKNLNKLRKFLIINYSYVDGTFTNTYKVTIGIDFVLKTISWCNSEKINLQFWDIAGKISWNYA
jgi:Ras-related protein Rab-32